MTKKFSPLEALAISDLPEKARYARMSYLMRKHRWVTNRPTLKDIKQGIENFYEPRGKKTAMQKILQAEIRRQISIVSQRSRARHHYTCEAVDERGYDPVAFRECWRNNGREANWAPNTASRWRAVIAARFNGPVSGLYRARIKARREGTPMPKPLIPHDGWYWSQNDPCPSVVEGAARIGGVYMFTTEPRFVMNGNVRLFQHTVRYLVLFRPAASDQPELLKAIRIPHGVLKAKYAVDKLKTSLVRKAEKRGDIVQVDWDREVWLVRNPKRKKWRELPFKRHSRNRKAAKDE